MNRFLKWLGNKLFPAKEARKSALNQAISSAKPVGVRPKPRPARKQPASISVDFDSEIVEISGRIEDGGPGKNVLVRNKYLREDSGTHDNLKIVDDTAQESDQEDGLDPYNTGRFDRSKNWQFRTRK